MDRGGADKQGRGILCDAFQERVKSFAVSMARARKTIVVHRGNIAISDKSPATIFSVGARPLRFTRNRVVIRDLGI